MMSRDLSASFGKYTLLKRLARGGMGEIFLAKQTAPSGFERLLVIKRILEQHLDNPEFLEMFFGEANLVSRLHHANIVQIIEMGQIDRDHYIAMEYVHGKSLRDLIDELRAQGRSMPVARVVELGLQLAAGLAYAHEATDIRGRPMNIVHRDINPHNLLVAYDGTLKIIDFGIAKSEISSVQTATGTIKGKFVYMSPEQSAAEDFDARSDLFSIGIVLYELLTLRNPFIRQNVVLSLEAIQRYDPPPPSSMRPEAAPLDPVILKALKKQPSERYSSVSAMIQDLREVARQIPDDPGNLSSFLREVFESQIEAEARDIAAADAIVTGSAHPRLPTPDEIAHQSQVHAMSRDLDVPPRTASQAASPVEASQTRLGRAVSSTLPKLIEGVSAHGKRAQNARLAWMLTLGLPLLLGALVWWLQPKSGEVAGHAAHVVAELGDATGDGEASRAKGAAEGTNSGKSAKFGAENAATRTNSRGRGTGAAEGAKSEKFRGRGTGAGANFTKLGDRGTGAGANFTKLGDRGTGAASRANSGKSAKFGARSADGSPNSANSGTKNAAARANSTDSGGRGTGAASQANSTNSAKFERKSAAAANSEKSKRKQPNSANRANSANSTNSRAPATNAATRPNSANFTAPDNGAAARANSAKPKPNIPATPIDSQAQRQDTPPRSDIRDATRTPEASLPGVLSIQAHPAASVSFGSSTRRAPYELPIRQLSGQFSLHGEQFNFRVKLRYRVESGGLSIAIRTDPWVMLKHNGLSLGRTPQGPLPAAKTHRLTLIHPGSAPLVINLRWKPNT